MVWNDCIGVYRYDGTSFKNFTTKDGLAGNRVGCIYQDKKGSIWFGTESGASRYDGKSFENFTTKEGLTNNDINSIMGDKTGTLWFGTRGSACTYDGKAFSKITHDEGVSFENVRTIIEDKQGCVWLGGNDGLWCLEKDSWRNATKDFVGSIYEDKKGNIWTTSQATDNSHGWVLSRYRDGFMRLIAPTATQVLTHRKMLFGILEDKAGGIWVGTVTGVCRYDGSNFDFFKDKRKGTGIFFDN